VSTWLQRALARREPVPTEPEAPSGGPSGSARQPVSIVPKGPRPEANGTNGTNGTAAVVIYIDPQERAAIAEHDGHVPRHFALGFAMLQAEHGENSAVMDDVGAFLDRWGRLADALGGRRRICSDESRRDYAACSPGSVSWRLMVRERRLCRVAGFRV
jgi:hypothetical protein